MGTPEFAVPSLKSLIESSHEISLVVTQPDRPSGRGHKITEPPVKVLARENGLRVFQPENLKKNSNELESILQIPCDFLVVVAFGQILPKKLLSHPKVAPLNVHASLLPDYRGAAPIARAILEGDIQTGVTIQWMEEALDMGDILLQSICRIEESDTAESLHDRLKFLGAQTLTNCLQRFEKNEIKRHPQNPRIGSYAPKLKKEESWISFQEPASTVHRKIMGLNPWPVAQCRMAGKVLRVFRSEFLARPTLGADPGAVLDTSDGEIVVACEDGCVGLLEVQLENRKRLLASEFLKGHPIPQGLILGDGKI